jgi:acylphosphatase
LLNLDFNAPIFCSSLRRSTILESRVMRARKFWISGQVQGVGYRYFAIRVARELGLKGWVRNLSDGRVEAYAAGPAKTLEDFEAQLRLGPLAGDVRGVTVDDASIDDRIEGFDIR